MPLFTNTSHIFLKITIELISSSFFISRIFKPERCVLVSQLYEKTTIADVMQFLSPFGKIQSIQLEFCEDTQVFKKSAIVEFENIECVLLALGLNGQKMRGVSTVVQPIMRKQQLDVCNRHKLVTLKVENLVKGSFISKRSWFKISSFILSLKFWHKW